MYERWVEAEHFYTTVMPLIIIGLIGLFFIYIVSFSYLREKGKAKKLVNVSLMVIVLSCAGYFIRGHSFHGFWVDQYDYINAGIREYSFLFGWKNEEDPQIVHSLGRSKVLYNNLSELEMYDVDLMSEPFNYDYIGSQGETHFFSMGEENQYVFRISGEVDWESNEREITGWQFILNDERFEALGFTNDFNLVFKSLSIPDQEEPHVEITDSQTIIDIQDVFEDWNFDNQHY